MMLIKLLYRLFPKFLFLIRKSTYVNYEAEMELLPVLCQAGMTSLDIGAKFGMYSYRLNRHSKDVIIFEPIEELNIALSKIFLKHTVDVMPLALSDSSGPVTMRTPLYKSGNPCYGRSSIEGENKLEFEEIDGWDEFTVDTSRLDDLSLENIGFIKIDVEGHEQAVLAGGLATILKNRPAMLIEANDNHLPQAVEKLFSWASSHDYLVFFMDGKKIMPSREYNIDLHHHQKKLENFILIHQADTERLGKLGLAS